MSKMMVIDNNGIKELNLCSCLDCNIDNEKEIPIYYSTKHAIEKGWVRTDDIKFCPPEDLFRWVCPECWNG